MEELINVLKKQPKEILQYIVFELMVSEVLSFTDVAEMHNEYLQTLRRQESKELSHLRSQVLSLWCGTKKDLGKALTALIQEGRDKGWANISQEAINNSKWNKYPSKGI